MVNINIVNMQLAAGEEIPAHDTDADLLTVVNNGRVEFNNRGSISRRDDENDAEGKT